MKKIILLIQMLLCTIVGFTQITQTNTTSPSSTESITLVTYGDGKNKDEAINVALRSALEQTFGTFVSANTSILNDELIKDEIVSISSGNIEDYKEINYQVLPDGRSTVTLKATVSINKLVSYAQAKGLSCELKTSAFMAQVKQLELRKQNTAKALVHLYDYIAEVFPTCFELSSSEPSISQENGIYYASMSCEISMIPEKYEQILNTTRSTLESLSVHDIPNNAGVETFKYKTTCAYHDGFDCIKYNHITLLYPVIPWLIDEVKGCYLNLAKLLDYYYHPANFIKMSDNLGNEVLLSRVNANNGLDNGFPIFVNDGGWYMKKFAYSERDFANLTNLYIEWASPDFIVKQLKQEIDKEIDGIVSGKNSSSSTVDLYYQFYHNDSRRGKHGAGAFYNFIHFIPAEYYIKELDKRNVQQSNYYNYVSSSFKIIPDPFDGYICYSAGSYIFCQFEPYAFSEEIQAIYKKHGIDIDSKDPKEEIQREREIKSHGQREYLSKPIE